MLSPRIIAALSGVFIGAMASGLNSRSGSLALVDIRGELGIGLDDGSWLSALFSTGELMVMPFAGWFAITFSIRRFFLTMLWTTALIALVVPLIVNPQLAMGLRLLQGMSGGALIPLLMMMAMKFLPPAIRLHGLALYALTATFTPNLAIWIVGIWSNGTHDLHWVAWQFLPPAVLCSLLVGWGLPKEPINWQRFATMDWLGLLTGMVGMLALGIGLAQGNRLDWFNSPLITFCLVTAGLCIAVFVCSEWTHPAPFIRFQLLLRRNLLVGFTVFVLMLVMLYSAAALPMQFLAAAQGYRVEQSAPIGLITGVPQLVLGSCVALLLYQKWVDARVLFSAGLLLIGLSCLYAAHLTGEWSWREFVPVQVMQALGQPLAIISMLFLTTSSVQPSEGPFVSGLVNMLRSMGSLAGVAFVGWFDDLRTHAHQTHLFDQIGRAFDLLPSQVKAAGFAMDAQINALTSADIYRALGWLALISVPTGLLFKHVPAPSLPSDKAELS
ncbi:MFS transporter [Paracoccus seriniphilus]|nr:MFS transporter [Paracoccus seriniphilus]